MSDFFSTDKEIITGIAPGRLDVMGGISDYSGSLLLQMPIRELTVVQVQQRDDNLVRIQSILGKKRALHFTISTDSIYNKTYEEVRKIMQGMEGGDWAGYVIGCIVVLWREKNIKPIGLNIFIGSGIPQGKGVSSSAALEVATLSALKKLMSLHLDDTELPLLAQKAENLVVGAPCGLMDQLSSYLGQKNKLLPLICQPHTVLEPIPLPPGISFCAIDSDIRHAVSGASYSDVRAAAFMAYTLVAMQEGCKEEELILARQKGDYSKIPFGGYLANISPSHFFQHYYNAIPELMKGADFIDRYRISIDAVTDIDPQKNYYLRNCALHPVLENFRIQSFIYLIQNFKRQKDKESLLLQMGELMYQSHSGYTLVGLGNDCTDELVQRVKRAGPAGGVYGARITGGGSGGTVVILCYGKKGKDTAKRIYEEYCRDHSIGSYFFYGSSDGALKLNADKL